ncbi:G1/S-specific cyclin CLN2 [Aaosphaeria arxii CBS 175.79]|uniref:G1/S-specific cyclin CLN2 n=1 Tax=Aaosphaeria arxii CBS 175.79 TaxID=1450172 RepID=A0A6A5YA27_9PLEO|nr:G1/S-specific cyclin CLN2 [Aaosphaeria arxii CBS 175.79]KAF2022073.1 G1/S-specific cyclin CLN2 [Aaosphaeria arxii CBS 175.79]
MAYPTGPSNLPTGLPRYNQCDSFFVESNEDGIYAMRAEARERERAVARMQQRALAEDLSRATAEEYQEDIMEHMENMESQTLPDVNSIDIQSEIQWFMRPYLLDFLIEAHAAFQLLPETLFLAVNLLDRYCSRRVVYKRHYQLVGCAALLIAAKYGDKKDRVPTVRELKSMCCSLYDDEMFTQMEWHVLQTLNWMIGHPTVDSFLQLALSEVAYDPEVENMTLYIAEIALFHKEFVSTKPSVLARSALALARCILSRNQAKPIEWAGAYDPQTVMSLSNHLYQPSQVLARKYASAHLSSVSTIVDDFLQRQAQIASRVAAPPTPPVTGAVNDYKPAYLGPQTPQKNQYGTVVHHGCITPPITPDNVQFGQGHPARPQDNHVYPTTPTPDHPAVMIQPQYYHNGYLQPQHEQ